MSRPAPRTLPAFALGALGLAAGAVLAQGDAAPVSVERLSQITRTLASDEFEGRAPGTPGERRTIEYLVAQFKAAGLEPAAPDVSFVQVVPLLRTQVPVDAAMSFAIAGERVPHAQQ
ncbi:MAG: peptidase M20, partial [Steroidobacteraceae bacterium]